MAEAVIFDMDGVLVNTEPYHFEVEKLILREMGIEITDNELYSFVGLAADKMWERIKKAYSLRESVSSLVSADIPFRVKYFRSHGKIQPLEGVGKLIEGIIGYGLKTAVASSSHPDLIKVVLEASELIRFFPLCLSGFQVKKGKPEPDIFIETARQLGVECSKCVVIEDSYNGVTAAKKAGMKCVGYVNPFSGNQDFSAADMVIDDFSDLNPALLKDF